jgi:hypothetical protein
MSLALSFAFYGHNNLAFSGQRRKIIALKSFIALVFFIIQENPK